MNKSRTGSRVTPPLALAGILLAALLAGSRAPGDVPVGASCRVGGEVGTRLAIATVSASPDAEISAFAGRTPYFLLFDGGVGPIDVVANDFADRDRSAGARAAYLLSELEVDCLVAGEVGSRMRSVLAAENIGIAVAAGLADQVAADVWQVAGGVGARAGR